MRHSLNLVDLEEQVSCEKGSVALVIAVGRASKLLHPEVVYQGRVLWGYR